MLDREQLHLPDRCNQDAYQYLPEMTALLIEGLALGPEERQMSTVWPNLLSSGRNLRRVKELAALTAGENAAFLPSANETILPIEDGESPGARTAPNDKLRIFIGGISNCFNNIFMGIWGNASLIHMDKNASETVRKGLGQIERLIHHGSVLIHIVFGYLAESRMEARHIRLNQLLQQIYAASLSKDGTLDSKTMKSCLRWVSRLSHPAHLSRSISWFFEKLLHWIEQEHRLVLAQTAADKATRERLMTIDALIKRGFAFAEQLKQYGGGKPVVMQRMRIKSLIKHTLNQFELSRHGIDLETDLSAPLPDIMADRSQLSKVLIHLIANAIDAMPKGGHLNVATHLLSKERSQERLFLKSEVDYLVISVSDSGVGMPSQVLSRIFDPFYVDVRKPNHLGLGLSIANSIVKAHSGYLQVSSHQGKGSTFRIYLPCPFNSRYPGDASWTGLCWSGRRRVHAASQATQGNVDLPIS